LYEWYFRNQPITEAPQDTSGFVYTIENLTTGRRYIGKKYFLKNDGKQSDWRKYFGSSAPLQEDIRNLGKDKFKRTIDAFCVSREDTCEREIELQCQHDVLHAILPDGTRAFYNCYIHPGKFRNEGPSPKISATNRRRKYSPETRRKLSEANTGHSHTMASRQKMSAARRGLLNHMFGATHTEESRRKMSEARKGKPLSLAHKEKLTFYRRSHTTETKNRIRASKLGY